MKRITGIAACLGITAATVLTSLTIQGEEVVDLSARRHHYNERVADANGNGLIRSHKTGATARVGASHAAAFQAYIDDLEAHGATIRFMGGIRRGHCSSGHMHPCGRALDVCQYSRDVVDKRCNLPGRAELAHIAAAHGLFEGGQWCNGDMGHAQAGVSAPACGERGNTMIARRRGTTRTLMARSHHRRHYRVAYAQPAVVETPMWNRP